MKRPSHLAWEHGGHTELVRVDQVVRAWTQDRYTGRGLEYYAKLADGREGQISSAGWQTLHEHTR